MAIPFYTELGDLSIIPNVQGEWDFRKVYQAGSLVSYNGKLYEAQTLVDHSGDTPTLLNHDDFHRPDTLDGWGTSTEGFDWVFEYSPYSGFFKISSNQGNATAVSRFDDGIIFYEIPYAGTTNVEVVWKFSLSNAVNIEPSFLFNTSIHLDDDLGETLSVDITNLPENLPTYIFQDLSLNTFKLVNPNGPQSENITINPYGNPFPLIADTQYVLRIQVSGLLYRTRIWAFSDVEPDIWPLELKGHIQYTPATAVGLDFFVFNDGAAINIQEVSIYGLPDVSPDQMPSEWLLIG